MSKHNDFTGAPLNQLTRQAVYDKHWLPEEELEGPKKALAEKVTQFRKDPGPTLFLPQSMFDWLVRNATKWSPMIALDDLSVVGLDCLEGAGRSAGVIFECRSNGEAVITHQFKVAPVAEDTPSGK